MLDFGPLIRFIYWSVVMLYFAIAGVLVYMAIRLPRTFIRKTISTTVVVFAVSVLPAVYIQQSVAQENADALKKTEQAKFREAAWAHFRKRCKESAGEKIYRTVDNVEGFYLAKPRKRPTEDELRDQYWMGNPYGLVLYPPAEISRYLHDLNSNDIPTTKSTLRRGFRFVETPRSDGSQILRHRLDNTRDKVSAEVSETRRSRYAVTHDDISTKEDRMYWVAGGRLQVIDLKSNEVLAERTGYVFEAGFGLTSGGRRPWLFAEDIACPPIKRNVAIDRLFVEKVLKPFNEESHAK